MKGPVDLHLHCEAIHHQDKARRIIKMMPYCRKDEEIRLKSAQFGLGSWVTTFPGKEVCKQVFTKKQPVQ